MSEQRRQYSRIRFSSGARLLVADRELNCAVLDLSLRGALLTFDGNLPALRLDERCLLEITLGDTRTVIRMEGNLAHAEGRHLGLTCREIDLDSITHLRRLLALNLGDADLLNRELAALVAGA
ncbi:PilZ domain-containing protein [Parazoarcus communis]|uniref:Cyclic diguanosine monophosphate-binding protein n=1 Tax=Parazoarcus communis TaxID=41977 RepID=A0A2U8GZB5_9RHOO|nr:PilZ domain-containing protein [Parazoarcus communis]AWI78794.1 PilZ domain-containing protein [Parazoarcus communis]